MTMENNNASEELEAKRSAGKPTSESDLLRRLDSMSFIGRSYVFKKTMEKIARFCICQAPILLEGETGSGKELAARALHYLGERSNNPFIPVNCGAFPESMFENELFGHTKGAFTDASAKQPGLIDLANTGTLFLDEVDSLPLKSQTTLLRFLQDKQYRPLGSSKLCHADVNVICATNANLPDLVNQGTFREDLLYRINVIKFAIPSLHERGTDVLLLANHFLALFEEQYRQGRKRLHPDTQTWLLNYSWPGNVRELQNLLHKEYLLADGPEIQLPEAIYRPAKQQEVSVKVTEHCLQYSYAEVRERFINAFETQYLSELMQHTHGNISAAARLINKERRSLGRLLDKHGIKSQDFY